jgi:hypothetical protein
MTVSDGSFGVFLVVYGIAVLIFWPPIALWRYHLNRMEVTDTLMRRSRIFAYVLGVASIVFGVVSAFRY